MYIDPDTQQELTESDLHNRYDDMLDEVYLDLTIAGLEYTTSQALKTVDPVAYRTGFSDWLDIEIQDGIIQETTE